MSATAWRAPNEQELAEMIQHAYDMGLAEDHVDEGKIDWDAVYRDCESMFVQIDLGTDRNSEPLKAIASAYRRGRRDIIN